MTTTLSPIEASAPHLVGERALPGYTAAFLRYPLAVLSDRLELMAVVSVQVADCLREPFFIMRAPLPSFTRASRLVIGNESAARGLIRDIRLGPVVDPTPEPGKWCIRDPGVQGVSLGPDGPFKVSRSGVGRPQSSPITAAIDAAGIVTVWNQLPTACDMQCNWAEAFTPPPGVAQLPGSEKAQVIDLFPSKSTS